MAGYCRFNEVKADAASHPWTYLTQKHISAYSECKALGAAHKIARTGASSARLFQALHSSSGQVMWHKRVNNVSD